MYAMTGLKKNKRKNGPICLQRQKLKSFLNGRKKQKLARKCICIFVLFCNTNKIVEEQRLLHKGKFEFLLFISNDSDFTIFFDEFDKLLMFPNFILQLFALISFMSLSLLACISLFSFPPQDVLISQLR